MAEKNTIVKTVTNNYLNIMAVGAQQFSLLIEGFSDLKKQRSKEVKDLNRSLRKWVYKFNQACFYINRLKQEVNDLQEKNEELIKLIKLK